MSGDLLPDQAAEGDQDFCNFLCIDYVAKPKIEK